MEDSLKLTLKRMKANETLISAILGSIVLLVAGILLVEQLKPTRIPSIDEAALSTAAEDLVLNADGSVSSDEAQSAPPEARATRYQVEEGESLWQIAVEHYGNGFNWIDIAEANGLENGDLLAVGQEISLPDAPERGENGSLLKPARRSSYEVTMNATIVGDQYTVSEGDTLWAIAIEVYGDGYQWTRLFDANSDLLENPNVIAEGMQLRVPKVG